ncbi:cell wall metabolism sensor histidine kinase WalK [Paenibacillus sp. P26]|nr:cell wall metabolism sensor histidine kinase WalK [Paenibacillus sp. P26]
MNSGLYDKIKEHTADLEAANAALKRKNDELSRLETSRSHLLSNISHDLGTPLTTIRRYVEAILDDMVETKEQTGPLSPSYSQQGARDGPADRRFIPFVPAGSQANRF